MGKGFYIALAVFLLLLLLPFYFYEREGDGSLDLLPGGDAVDTLVIIASHPRQVKWEFERAFRDYYRAKHGREVRIDWRDVGGTSDAANYIDSRFASEFRNYYDANYPGEWSAAAAAGFNDAAYDDVLGDTAEAQARRRFLASDVSIGIDLLWGGGTYEHERNARRGYAVDGGVAKRHPEYFVDSVIPEFFTGETLYDAGGRFYGGCLSSMGICCNPDRYAELGLPLPVRWSDLGRPELYGYVAVGDPSKTGSVAKCFELIIQQEMQEARRRGEDDDAGWRNALTLLKRIIGNSYIVTDAAGKIPREVSSGSGAAGVCIDFYGFLEAEWSESRSGGKERIRYVMPENGSTISPDQIQLLRGAPNRHVAEEFLDFLLSYDAQKLWSYKAGTPGGPERYTLRRPPIRRDLYTPDSVCYMPDPDYNPYESELIYQPELTGRYFSLIRTLIKCVMVDTVDDLRRAWGAIIAAGGPDAVPEAYAAFTELPFDYREASHMAELLTANGDEWDMYDVIRLRAGWTENARNSYRRAIELAGEGR